MGTTASGPLTLPQYRVYRQLARDFPCTADEWSPLAESDITDHGCTDDSSGQYGGRGDGQSSDAGGSNRPDTTRESTSHATGGTARPGTVHAARGTARPGTVHTAGGTARPGTVHAAGGTARPGTAHAAGGTARPGTAHAAEGTARPGTAHAAGDTARPGTGLGERDSEREGNPHVFVPPDGAPEAIPLPPGKKDGSGASPVHPALLLGLGVGAGLALLTAAGCLLACCLRRRAARTTRQPKASAQRTRRVEGRWVGQEGCGWPSPGPSEYPDTTAARDAARRPPPEILDYAEPLSAAPAEGDYAEIPGMADYASPISATRGKVAESTDYAEIPGMANYADPHSATGKAAECGDYADIPPVDGTSGSIVDNYAALTPIRQPSAELAAAAGPRPVEYAEVCKSARSTPTAAGGSPCRGFTDDREDAESVAPPLPPATAQRMQMLPGMLENALYAPPQEVMGVREWKKTQTKPVYE